MRLCIVTPSEEFAASAGVRIRYDRLQAAAGGMGHAIDIVPLGEFQSRGDFRHDAYVFAKTYSPVAPVLAWRMRQSGKRVGLDVFDDYFTQHDDARLLRYRQWFSAMQAAMDFYLCSTSSLARAIAPLTEGKPLCVIADPAPAIPSDELEQRLRQKQQHRDAGELRVLWFGIGDNPYFPVGLRDLVNHGSALSDLSKSGRAIDLRILTNRRALNPEGLALLRRLPVPYTIEEWTEEREADELTRADVAFLPVSAQPFSRVKSLNRAVTALVKGTQVLTAGFPLYAPLDPFIYRNAAGLAADFAAGALRLRPETCAPFLQALDHLANPVLGVESLFELLSSIRAMEDVSPSKSQAFPPDVLVVHGARPDGRVHKLAPAFGGLTVKGPDCSENWNCNIRFDCTGTAVRVFVEDSAADFVAPPFRDHLKPHGMIGNKSFFELMPDAQAPIIDAAASRLLASPTLPNLAAAAPALRNQTAAILKALFPGAHLVVNDRLALSHPSSWSSA